jgi:hypothetical protein
MGSRPIVVRKANCVALIPKDRRLSSYIAVTAFESRRAQARTSPVRAVGSDFSSMLSTKAPDCPAERNLTASAYINLTNRSRFAASCPERYFSVAMYSAISAI